jgi:tRNA threonylcarbamoyl adenosine modification protein (Sua5/YciO/YrdC/YwlC family)
MILELNPQSIDQRQIIQIVNYLNQGGIAIVPSDTVYAVVCSLSNKKGLDNLAAYKGSTLNKLKFSLIFNDFTQLSAYTSPIDRSIFRLLKTNLPGPFTFILNAHKNVSKLFLSKRSEMGMRMPDNAIIQEIIKQLGNPLASTSLHKEHGDTDSYFTDPDEIYEQFEDEFGLIVLGGTGNNVPSTIIDCSQGEINIIRQGLGIIKT